MEWTKYWNKYSKVIIIENMTTYSEMCSKEAINLPHLPQCQLLYFNNTNQNQRKSAVGRRVKFKIQ